MENINMQDEIIFEAVYCFNTDKICRLCLSPNDTLQPIFENDNRDMLLNKIFECTSIMVSDENQLPTSLCLVCYQKIEDYYIFRKDCLKNDEVLKSKPVEIEKIIEETIVESADEIETDYEIPAKAENVSYSSIITNGRNTKTFSCNQCEKKFTYKSSLNAHLNTHSNNKPFSCQICTKSFSDSSNYKRHLKVHENVTDKKYICELCSKAFKSASSLNVHIRVHTGKTPYECKLCNQNFSQWYNLQVHIRKEHDGTGLPPKQMYECSLCEKSFTEKSNLKKHLKLHETANEKAYKCHICSKSFNRNDTLKVHSRIHSGDTPFKCKQCPERFGRWYNYKEHLRRAHMKEEEIDKKYPCPLCSKIFFGNSRLNAHMKTHNKLEREFQCENCSKTFYSSTHLKEHSKTHTKIKPYSCQTCGKHFGYANSYRRHLRIHSGEKPFSCTENECSAKFACSEYLSEHIKTHSNQKDFICEICSKSFKNGYRLKIHIRHHTGERKK